MEYKSVLKKIEQERKNENLSTKLYRYAGIIKAIDFFSQKLNVDQIIESAFDFVNELLIVEKSAIYSTAQNGFILKKSKGITNTFSFIPSNESLESIPMLYGTLIYGENRLNKYFDKEMLKEFETSIVIPLTTDNVLVGFVFIGNKSNKEGTLDSEDFIIAEALMKLFNNSLEENKRYEELKKVNNTLDEKIFNLFAINQSSKALLSEINLDVLYDLSVDVFAELTQSSATSFVLYDERSEGYVIKGFKDILYRPVDTFNSFMLNKDAKIEQTKLIINLESEKDVNYFIKLFNEEVFSFFRSFDTAYIVLILKNDIILGFVSLGKTTTGYEYKESIFELIESLASSTYIALSNASYFKQVNEQKKIIQNKLNKLISLNKLVKNINSSINLETLLDMTLKTLNASFGVEKAFIALYDKDNELLKIFRKLNLEPKKDEIKVKQSWKKVFEGDIIYDAKQESVNKYFDKNIWENEKDLSGVLIIPIYIEVIEVELKGVIVIFNFNNSLINDEENLLILETIANHTAPVLSNLYTIEEQKRFLLPNIIEVFKSDLKSGIKEAKDFNLELQVIQITNKRDFGFIENNVMDNLKLKFDKVYPLTYNDTFIIESGQIRDIEKIIKEILDEGVKVRTLVLGKDFKDFKGFFKHF